MAPTLERLPCFPQNKGVYSTIHLYLLVDYYAEYLGWFIGVPTLVGLLIFHKISASSPLNNLFVHSGYVAEEVN